MTRRERLYCELDLVMRALKYCAGNENLLWICLKLKEELEQELASLK